MAETGSSHMQVVCLKELPNVENVMNYLKMYAAALLLCVPAAAQSASVSVTIGKAGVMEADQASIGATGLLTETFDSLPTGQFSNFESELGTYSSGRVKPANRYGGAHDSQYLFSLSNPGSTLSLKTSARYFGLWWSAGSVGNSVELIKNGARIFVFNTDDVLDFLDANTSNTADYYGNPNDRFANQVRHEPFVFLNMFSDQPFDAVRLSGRNFESDNHTVAATFARETGTSISPVPVPKTLPFLIAAFGGFAFLSRRRRP